MGIIDIDEDTISVTSSGNSLKFETFSQQPESDVWQPYMIGNYGAGLWYKYVQIQTTKEVMDDPFALVAYVKRLRRMHWHNVLIDTPSHSLFPFQIKGLDAPQTCPDELFIVWNQANFVVGTPITAVRLNLDGSIWYNGERIEPGGWQDWQAIAGCFYLSQIFRWGTELYPPLEFPYSFTELMPLIEFTPLGDMTQTSEGQYRVSNPTEGTYQIDPETFLLTRIDEPADKMPRPPENDQDQ